MKKRGFTLIELLAVIVILAIIALIAVPAVLNIIEDSRKGAAEASTRNIVSAAKTYYAQQTMQGGSVEKIDLSANILKYNGDQAEKGYIEFTDGKPSGKLYIGGYCVEITIDGKLTSEKVDNEDCTIGVTMVTLTLNADGGELVETAKTYNSGDKLGELPTPTKLGYTFKGWKLADGTLVTSDTVISENIIITAIWEQIVIDTSEMSLVLSVENSNRGYVLHGEIEGANTDANLTSVKYEIYFAESIYSADEELLDTITMTNASENFAFEYEYQSDRFPAMEMFKVIAYVSETNTLIKEESIETECFVAGTKVLTENGYTNIEDIKKGDMVYSYNLDTNELELKEVTRTVVSSTIDTYKMTIGTEVVEMSVKHELYLIDKGWVRAYDVEVGDKMLDSKGNEIEITNIEYTKYDEPIPTYNLTVDGNHNYFVTNIQALVHNTGSSQ